MSKQWSSAEPTSKALPMLNLPTKDQNEFETQNQQQLSHPKPKKPETGS